MSAMPCVSKTAVFCSEGVSWCGLIVLVVTVLSGCSDKMR